ncbi:putative O-glycosylation ligase, exosortase A system-associated [Janthinobacterium sp. 17J80-10]|uniref:putative O-glycosylation ligase, exosortase A system-associated n=1 Tax=Janthinobacterium sp. 17J80-10 TaxID=2497863 RepID=UPI001005A5C7|nr:putative O-glycosylation ligase, exosortase A system-associated [Janthinobacterium sp. 17J80-10]QAU35403.1 putative O-glycosylation ligase, exosortase A system-associated [Janthinobacterium sp. 17J80-10]
MRDLLIFGLVFALIPFIFKRPAVGILAFMWISLMNPHRLTYGAAYDFPFAALIGGITIISAFMSKDRKHLPLTPVTAILIVFMVWTTFTTLFAQDPKLAWEEWSRVSKTFLVTFLAMTLVNSEKEIKAFPWVLGLSLGFYGLKGGIFTLASGGKSHVLGPEGSYITDNNCLALALITTLPLIWHLQGQAQKKWQRYGLRGLAILTMIAAAGSYSRGALLAAAAMLFFLWLKSSQKLRTGAILLLLVPLIYAIMPEKWFARMETIDDYKEDSSALGRLNAWHFAFNVAKDHFLGGGYIAFTPSMFLAYAPDPIDFHVAHSIYFQVLGEHGFIGLGLFLALMVSAWRTGSRILQFCRGREELKHVANLAAMLQVSIIGYAVGGAFLSLAYYDLYYYFIALLVLLEKVFMMKPAIATSFPGIRGASTVTRQSEAK